MANIEVSYVCFFVELVASVILKPFMFELCFKFFQFQFCFYWVHKSLKFLLHNCLLGSQYAACCDSDQLVKILAGLSSLHLF